MHLVLFARWYGFIYSVPLRGSGSGFSIKNQYKRVVFGAICEVTGDFLRRDSTRTETYV